MKRLLFRYKERFAFPGEMSADDVTALLAELDPFLDGFFLALARQEFLDLLYPVVENLKHTVHNDEALGITRIVMTVDVLFNYVDKATYPVVQQAFNDAMSAFLGTRFPENKSQKGLWKGKKRC